MVSIHPSFISIFTAKWKKQYLRVHWPKIAQTCLSVFPTTYVMVMVRVMGMAMMISWAWTWSASLADNWDWLTQRAPSEQERWTASWRKQKTKQIQKTNIVDKTELTATDAFPSIFLSSFILIYDLTWEKSQWENTLRGKKQIQNKEKHKQKDWLNFWWKKCPRKRVIMCHFFAIIKSIWRGDLSTISKD